MNRKLESVIDEERVLGELYLFLKTKGCSEEVAVELRETVSQWFIKLDTDFRFHVVKFIDNFERIIRLGINLDLDPLKSVQDSWKIMVEFADILLDSQMMFESHLARTYSTHYQMCSELKIFRSFFSLRKLALFGISATMPELAEFFKGGGK